MASDISADKTSLTFKTTDWDTKQTMTVTAGQDSDAPRRHGCNSRLSAITALDMNHQAKFSPITTGTTFRLIRSLKSPPTAPSLSCRTSGASSPPTAA